MSAKNNLQRERGKTIVLVDAPLPDYAAGRLAVLPGVHTVPVEHPEERSRTLPESLIRDANVLLCTYPPANFDAMRELELIQITSAGYAQLTGLGLVGRGIRACNARGIFDVPIAEWNIAMMVALARNFRGMIRNQEAQVWDRSAIFQKEVRGLTVGIWGYGGIGRETARLAKAFGMKVLVLTRSEIGPRQEIYAVPDTGDNNGVYPDKRFSEDEQLDFLAQLDFLILALPLTKKSEGLIGERELKELPRSAYLVNPSRGPIIQEQAWVRALQEGWIRTTPLRSPAKSSPSSGPRLWSSQALGSHQRVRPPGLPDHDRKPAATGLARFPPARVGRRLPHFLRMGCVQWRDAIAGILIKTVMVSDDIDVLPRLSFAVGGEPQANAGTARCRTIVPFAVRTSLGSTLKAGIASGLLQVCP